MNGKSYSLNMKPYILCLPFIALLMSETTKAELGNTNIVMTANIIAKGCNVGTDSLNKFVDLGIWGAKRFKDNKSSEPIKFTINLTDCNVHTTGVKVTFNGDADPVDNTLFKLSGNDSAKNIGIAVLDKNKTKILPGKESIIYPISSNNLSALDFYAQYNATSPIVTGGSANSQVLFTLEYP